MRLKLFYMIMTILLGIILLNITYYIAYQGYFYNSIFWISILLISVPTYGMLIDEHLSEHKKIFLLFLFGTIIYIIRILPSTEHFHFQDELFTLNAANLIYESGNIGVKTNFDIARYFPGLEILTVVLKNISYIDIFPVARITMGIIHSMVLVFLYLFLKSISSGKLAPIGTFIYSLNPLYVFFDGLFAYESLGIFLFVVLLFLISKLYKELSMRLSILIIIIIPALVITHHFSSYMFLLLMSIVLIFYIIKENRIDSQKLHLVFLTAVFIFGWLIYVATKATDYLTSIFINRFSKIFELSLFGGVKKDLTTSLSSSILPVYEYITDTYLYAPVILLLSFFGVLCIYRYKRNYINIFIRTLTIYGPILYTLSLAFVPTSGEELAERMWGFLYIGLSFFISIPLYRITNKITLFSLVIIIIIAGISIGDKPIHRVPDLLNPRLISGPGSITTDVFYASDWFKKNFGINNRMAGDRTTTTVFGAVGEQNAERWHSWEIFFPQVIDKNVLSFIQSSNFRYIIVDNRMTKYLGEYNNYFDNVADYQDKYPVYGKQLTLPVKSINKFEIFNKFYDNGNIVLYKI